LPAPPSNSSGDDDPQESPPPTLSTSATTAQTPRRDRLGTASDISRPREAKPSNRRRDSTHAQRAMKVQPVNEQCVALIADIRLVFCHRRALEVGLCRAHQPSPDARQNFDGCGLQGRLRWLVSRCRPDGSTRPQLTGIIGAPRLTARARELDHSSARNPAARARTG